MLTSSDLNSIKKLVNELIDPLRLNDAKLNEDIKLIESRTANLILTSRSTEKSIETIQKDVLEVKIEIKKIRKDQKETRIYLEHEQISHRDEIRKIGRHVGVPIAV